MKAGIKQLGMIATVAAMSTSAMAYEAGDWIVRGGATTVAPDASSSTVTLDGVDAFGGSTLDVDDNTQLGLTISYMLSSQWGIELLAATPFVHDVEGDSGALNGADIAEVTHLPPTLSAIYYFMPESDFKPYLGAGLNYTLFFDEDAKGPVDGGSIDLDDSFGVSLQVGFDYQLNDNWHINASVRWIDIETDATIDVAGLGRIASTVEIDPLVYSVMFGYRF